MPTGVSLFVWLPEERAKWGRGAGQAGPRHPRHVRAMSADLEKAQAEGVELSHRCDNRGHRQQTVAVSHWARIWAQNLLS
jgi:DNA-binding IclR family transcriptional regulator